MSSSDSGFLEGCGGRVVEEGGAAGAACLAGAAVVRGRTAAVGAGGRGGATGADGRAAAAYWADRGGAGGGMAGAAGAVAGTVSASGISSKVSMGSGSADGAAAWT